MKTKIKFGVYDSTGALLRAFNTFKMAMTYKINMGRHDWIIKQING